MGRRITAVFATAFLILVMTGCGPATSVVDDFESYTGGSLTAPWCSDSDPLPDVQIDTTSGSRAAFLGYGAFVCYHSGSSATDCLVKVWVRWNDYNNAVYGVIARRTGLGTYYRLTIGKPYGMIGLLRSVDSACLSLDDYDLPSDFAYGSYHELKLEVVGTSIKGYLDGAEVVSATDAEITGSGCAGIVLINGSVYFDDFERHLF